MRESKILQRSLNDGGMDRRTFITKATGMGLAAAIPSVMFSKFANAKGASKGGRFRLGLSAGSSSDTLDPGLIYSAFGQNLGRAMRNHLVEYTNQNELVPALAESWDSTSDAKKWIFKLRAGVEFSNGKSLDANDVVASFNHHRRKDGNSGAQSVFSQISEIKTDGKDTIVFTLPAGNVDFPFIVNDYHALIMPAKADGSANWQSGIGTGGYILQDYKPGSRAFLKRNPNYWKSNSAYFDEVEIISIKNVAERTNALRSGKIDAMDRCNVATLGELQNDKNINVVEVLGRGYYSIPMTMDVSPFDNNHIRMALKLGIDRNAIIDTILFGHGFSGNDHPISPGSRYHNSRLSQRGYDPNRAKWHLNKAGIKNLTVDVSVAEAAFLGATRAGEMYKEQAAKAGITLNLVHESDNGYWSDVWLKKPFRFCYWQGRLVENEMFTTAYLKGAPWNDTHISIERLDKLILLARAERNEETRREMYFEMQEIVHKDGGTIVPAFFNEVSAVRKNIVFPQKYWSSEAELDGLMAIERWAFS